MIPKVEIVEHVNDIVRLISILLAQFVENAHLYECLMMESLLIANDFDCHILIGFMIQCTNDLSETSFANHLQYLVAIANVIMNDLEIAKVSKINLTVGCVNLLYYNFHCHHHIHNLIAFQALHLFCTHPSPNTRSLDISRFLASHSHLIDCHTA